LQFTWDSKGDGSEIIKFGVGAFVAPITTQPVTQSFKNNGFTHKSITFSSYEDMFNALQINQGNGNFKQFSLFIFLIFY